MDNAYAKMAIMMIIQIIYVNYALFNFGLFYYYLIIYNNNA